jgi:hypothetical protein
MTKVIQPPTKWMPPVGSIISVTLPEEIVRGTVTKKVNDDTLDVKLDVQPTMGKSHSYRFRQTVRVMRRKAQPSGDRWITEDVES